MIISRTLPHILVSSRIINIMHIYIACKAWSNNKEKNKQ